MPSSSSESPKGAERLARRATKRRILLTGFALLVVAGLAVMWSSREPTVDGKPISYWISEFGTSGSGNEAALDKLGPEKTIPYLLRTIAGKDLQGSGWQRFYRRHHGKIPGFLRQRLPAPQAAPTPGRTEYVQIRAGYYLVHLADKQPLAAGRAIRPLVPLLESSNRIARFSAGIALSGFGSNAAPAVPVIEKLLRNNPEKVHDVMLSVLEKCGPKATVAIPTLKNRLGSTNGNVAIACARTLWALDPSQADLVRSVAKKISAAADAGNRMESASLLWRLDKDPVPVVPVLIGLLNEDDHPFDYRAILLLKRIGPEASNAIPALTARLNRTKRTEAFFLKAAAEALDAMGGVTPTNSTTVTSRFGNQ